jgi:hypothetical protein
LEKQANIWHMMQLEIKFLSQLEKHIQYMLVNATNKVLYENLKNKFKGDKAS